MKVFWVLGGIVQGYAMAVSYVSAPMTCHKRDMGLVAGLISGIRNLGFGLLGKFFSSPIFRNVVV